jgi:hypothetical protein
MPSSYSLSARSTNHDIIQAPVTFGRLNVRTLAILLLIAATLSLQAASLSSDHSNDHLAHCCSFCHFAHLALANPAQALAILALVVSEWHVAIQKCSGYRETLVALGHSRAPPA